MFSCRRTSRTYPPLEKGIVMSKSIMAEVPLYSQAKRTAQHFLLLIASYAENDGTGAYPSLQTLANLSGYTERTVQTYIKRLETDKHIAVERQKEPGKRPHNRYTILRPWHREETPTERMIT